MIFLWLIGNGNGDSEEQQHPRSSNYIFFHFYCFDGATPGGRKLILCVDMDKNSYVSIYRLRHIYVGIFFSITDGYSIVILILYAWQLSFKSFLRWAWTPHDAPVGAHGWRTWMFHEVPLSVSNRVFKFEKSWHPWFFCREEERLSVCHISLSCFFPALHFYKTQTHTSHMQCCATPVISFMAPTDFCTTHAYVTL